MREMLDAAGEIWLNIFWLNLVVAALDAISPVKEPSSHREQSGRMRLPGVRKTPHRGKYQALARVEIESAESKNQMRGGGSGRNDSRG